MKTKRLVWTLGLGLVLGGLGACGDDLGKPRPDAGGSDGGKADGGGGKGDGGGSAQGSDGGGSAQGSDSGTWETGLAGSDGGDKGEVGRADAGAGDYPGGGEDGRSDAGAAADLLTGVDAASDPRPPTVIVDATRGDGESTRDVPSVFDAAGETGRTEAAVDVGPGETGNQSETDADRGGGIDGSSDTLAIPLAGEQFSPPLANTSALPSGTWYCDMGTVHWAQGEQGNGICPVCGMDLVKKP